MPFHQLRIPSYEIQEEKKQWNMLQSLILLIILN